VINDILIIKTWAAELPDFEQPLLSKISFEATLGLDNPVILRHGWRLEASLLEEWPESPLIAVKNIPNDEAWMDYDRLSMPLTVRGTRKGERFQPLGMRGHSQSLQDFLVNLKVPAHLRPIWPLVVSGETIAWVVGLRPAQDCKITGKTQRILKLKLNKCEN
jgi:tRNA(Ile)-lysidine synthetase-like protein